MAIKSVWIEEDCIACGTCEGICPEVFQVTDRSRVNEGVNFNDYEEGIKEAPKAARSASSNTIKKLSYTASNKLLFNNLQFSTGRNVCFLGWKL